CIEEAELLEPVEEAHRGGQAGTTVALEHELTERTLLHVPVLESDFLRYDLVEQHATRGGAYPARTILVVYPEVNGRRQREGSVSDRHLHLGGRGVAR